MVTLACALGATAAEAYACYTPSNTTLTFYYDNLRSSRSGTTYDLNTGTNDPGWYTDGTRFNVTQVVFDPSFVNARPTSTIAWFNEMRNLEYITGMSYLNTSEVTHMGWMFGSCNSLTSLDLSHFNTSKVTSMHSMFLGSFSLTSLDLSSFNTAQVTEMNLMFAYCQSLRTIYAGSGWSTAAVVTSNDMFYECSSLMGSHLTAYDANHVDKTYAHIDGGPSNPGYFTDKNGPIAYACYTPSNTTLTFYYDTERDSRTGVTYDLNTGSNNPSWYTDGNNANVTKVVFDSSFAGIRPTTTFAWFSGMQNLESITGMGYLNTSEVTNMASMFIRCSKLVSLDVSHFNTSKVENMQNMFNLCSVLTSLDMSSFNTSEVTVMSNMFRNCSNLQTITVGDDWNTAAVSSSVNMFYNCASLVGGQGTTYNNSNPKDKTYAHIDGGPSNPGYFTAKGGTVLRGDVNGNNEVTIADVSALIDYLLTGDTTGINMAAADCNGIDGVTIADVSALIDYLLTGSW